MLAIEARDHCHGPELAGDAGYVAASLEVFNAVDVWCPGESSAPGEPPADDPADNAPTPPP